MSQVIIFCLKCKEKHIFNELRYLNEIYYCDECNKFFDKEEIDNEYKCK